MAREKLKVERRIGSGFVDARSARLWVSYASLGIAAATAVICAYYLFVGFGYSTDSTSGNALTESASLAWNARVVAAGASLQTTLWARRLIILGVLSFSTFPFARLRGRTLLERSGLISRDWKKAVASWAFVASCSLLALVALLNYYANATTWAISSDFLQMILFLGLSPLNNMVYDPIGMLGGAGEIAKWFAIFLVLTVVSFFSVRVRLGIRRALSDSVLVLLSSLLLYELGLVLLCSNYDYVWVTALQIGTPLQWFSNADLLYVSALGVAGLVLAKSKVQG